MVAVFGKHTTMIETPLVCAFERNHCAMLPSDSLKAITPGTFQALHSYGFTVKEWDVVIWFTLPFSASGRVVCQCGPTHGLRALTSELTKGSAPVVNIKKPVYTNLTPKVQEMLEKYEIIQRRPRWKRYSKSLIMSKVAFFSGRFYFTFMVVPHLGKSLIVRN